MSEPLAIFGTYTDLVFKKGLEVVRITVEIPMKEAAGFIEKFGAPNAVTPVPVVLARHDPNEARAQRSAPESAPHHPVPIRPVRNWRDMPRSQQCALSCQNKEFQEWCANNSGHPWSADVDEQEREAWTLRYVRSACGIESRKELDTDGYKGAEWDKLRTSFSVKDYGLK